MLRRDGTVHADDPTLWLGLLRAVIDVLQWKQKHQTLMLRREHAEEVKASDLKAKVGNAKQEAKEQRLTYKEHFESATTMMRVVASTFAKLAAVENAREKDFRQKEMQVGGGGGGGGGCEILIRRQAAAEARRSSSLDGKGRASR